jgi:hypothetical protein
MIPGAPAELAGLTAIHEVREPRPYKTRYPIPDAEFVPLKDRAYKVKLARGKPTAAPDTGQKAERCLYVGLKEQ